MNPYSIPTFITAILILLLGIIIFVKNQRGQANRAFFILSFVNTIWLFFTSIAYNCSSEKYAEIYFRICYLGITNISVAVFHFVVTFLSAKVSKKFITALYILGFLFGILFISSDHLMSGVYKYFWGYYPKAGHSHLYFLFFWFTWAISGLILLVMHYFKQETSIVRKKQIKYVFIAFFIYFFASNDFIANYGLQLYPFGYLPTTIFLLIIAYCTVKYRILDISIAITRTGVFIFTYSLILGIPFILAYALRPYLIGFFGDKWWLVPMGLLTVLATVGPFIFIYINKKAEDRLLQEQRRYQHTLRQASSGMIRIRELRKLLDLIVYVVTKTVKIEFSAMFLINPGNNHYSMVAKRGALNLAADFSLDTRSPLIQELYLKKEPIVYEEIQLQSQDSPRDSKLMNLEKHLKEISASVIVPSYVGNKLLGFLVLGKKLSGKIYSQDDLNVFSVLANQAALAIENILSIEKLKDIQQQLSQSEKLAAMGRFAASIVHEVKNPITAIKTFTEYLPQKYQDKEFIEKYSRIVSGELDKIDNLSHQLLNFSKPTPLKLERANIHQLLDETLDLLSNDFIKHGIKVIKDYCTDNHRLEDTDDHRLNISDHRPKISDHLCAKIDAQQIKQVFLNLFLNAIESMSNGGTLTVSSNLCLSGGSKSAIICVQDAGSGISEKDLAHIFEPFYSTKEKGTGLGLAISYSIIKEHKGEIKVESEIGKGTRFEIVLPLSR